MQGVPSLAHGAPRLACQSRVPEDARDPERLHPPNPAFPRLQIPLAVAGAVKDEEAAQDQPAQLHLMPEAPTDRGPSTGTRTSCALFGVSSMGRGMIHRAAPGQPAAPLLVKF